MKPLPSLEQQIGQLFIVGFKGDSVKEGDSILKDIRDRNLGGVILFDRHLATKSHFNNIVNANQLCSLTDHLQQLGGAKLIIAVDQEGGRVNRFRKELGFAQTPSASRLGESNNLELTRKSSRQTALLLKEVGINLNLAPVADLNINSKNPIIGRCGRSFSLYPELVINHCRVWIEEHSKHGILCCLKHFPGHGNSEGDSHLGFVDISNTWNNSELIPFRQLIVEGSADAVMIGHLFNQHLDSRNPATLSKHILQTLLRDQLHFTGVTISDDMQMKAITERYGFEEACCRAVAAGIDVLIIGNNLIHDTQIFKRARTALLKGVDTGAISEKRIAEAWQRVQAFKNLIG
jgi:beta-N-acetylhexosaminidase